MNIDSHTNELPAVPEPTVVELLAEAESKANADPVEAAKILAGLKKLSIQDTNPYLTVWQLIGSAVQTQAAGNQKHAIFTLFWKSEVIQAMHAFLRANPIEEEKLWDRVPFNQMPNEFQPYLNRFSQQLNQEFNDRAMCCET